MDKRLSPVAFTAPAMFGGKPAEGAAREFSGVAYSGGVVTDHPFWNRVAFDLGSTKIDTPMPALLDHHKPVGVIKAAALGQRIDIGGRLFAGGDAAEVASMADQGMPWQLSVGIWPGRIEDVRAGSKVELNGKTLEGPLTVFRDNRIREVSFVALGADDKTGAQIFTAVSEGGQRPATTQEAPEMDQAQHDTIVGELNAKLTAAEARATTAETKVTELEAKFTAQALAQRTQAVKDLFAATGREYSDEKAKPYISMTDEAFTAVAADLRAAAPKKSRDPNLFRSTATEGQGGSEGGTTEDIISRAQQFIADQRTKGREVSVADAVAHVKAA